MAALKYQDRPRDSEQSKESKREWERWKPFNEKWSLQPTGSEILKYSGNCPLSTRLLALFLVNFMVRGHTFMTSTRKGVRWGGILKFVAFAESIALKQYRSNCPHLSFRIAVWNIREFHRKHRLRQVSEKLQ